MTTLLSEMITPADHRASGDSLPKAAARREMAANDINLVVTRVYYACFYAASALLLVEGHHFVKHRGVPAAIHQHLVRPGRLSTAMGKFYDQAFDDRHIAACLRFLEGDWECTTARLSEDVAVNVAPNGKVVGIEVLGASENLELLRDAPSIQLENLRAGSDS